MIAVLALLAALTTACTESGSGGSGPSGGVVSGSGQTPSPAVAKPGVYTLDKSGVSADLRYEAGGWTLIVTNRSGAQIAAPGIYLLGARDGRRVAGRVTGYAPIPDGATYTFKVALARAVAPEDVGLAILLVGAANFGAFVPPAG